MSFLKKLEVQASSAPKISYLITTDTSTVIIAWEMGLIQQGFELYLKDAKLAFTKKPGDHEKNNNAAGYAEEIKKIMLGSQQWLLDQMKSRGIK